jgi:hypothetical protein
LDSAIEGTGKQISAGVEVLVNADTWKNHVSLLTILSKVMKEVNALLNPVVYPSFWALGLVCLNIYIPMEMNINRMRANSAPIITHFGSTSITEFSSVLHQVNRNISRLHLRMRKNAPMNSKASLV